MTRRTLDQLYALTVPEIQKVFLETMQGIVDDVILSQMIQAIENNDAEALFKASGFTPAALSPILDRIEQTYREGALSESSFWPKTIISPAGPVRFKFHIRNPAVEKDLKEISSSLVTRLTNETKDNLRMTLQRGLQNGDNPRQTAVNIVGRVSPVTRKREGGIIGLTVPQERWVSNAGNYLKSLDAKYFSLTLRDKRFDSIVRKAIIDERSLTKAELERLTTSYKNKVLKYRGDTIARTETVQSLNRGAAASYTQAVDEGILSRNQIKKGWDDTSGPRTRDTHRSMGVKYGKGREILLDDVFISPSGSRLKFPGDISLDADASEIIHCRCNVDYTVDWLYNIKNG